jgi:hypothetical protein
LTGQKKVPNIQKKKKPEGDKTIKRFFATLSLVIVNPKSSHFHGCAVLVMDTILRFVDKLAMKRLNAFPSEYFSPQVHRRAFAFQFPFHWEIGPLYLSRGYLVYQFGPSVLM